MGIIIRGRKKERERRREFKGRDRQLGIGEREGERERVVNDQEPKKTYCVAKTKAKSTLKINQAFTNMFAPNAVKSTLFKLGGAVKLDGKNINVPLKNRTGHTVA